MFEMIREDWRTHERDIWRQGVWVLLAYRFNTELFDDLARAKAAA